MPRPSAGSKLLTALVMVAALSATGATVGEQALNNPRSALPGATALTAAGLPSNGSWNQPGGSAAHDGLSPLDGPQNGTLGWSRFLGADKPPSSVVQGGDGQLWVAEGCIIGIHPNGSLAEQFSPAGYGPHSSRLLPVLVAPAVEPYGDAVILNGANATAVQELSGFAGSAWRIPLPIGAPTKLGNLREDPAPTVAPGGEIYIASSWGKLYALDPHGTLRWKATLGSLSPGSPTVSANGTVYVTGTNGDVSAYSPAGRLIWSVALDAGGIGSGIALSPDSGFLYAGTKSGTVVAISPSGRELWNSSVGGAVDATPAIGPAGMVYTGTTNGNLVALSPTGKLRWNVSVGAPITDSPSVDSNGTVYVGVSNGYLEAFDASGSFRWQDFLGAPINSSIAIGLHGRLFVTTTTGYLWEVGYDPTGAANTLRVPSLWVTSESTKLVTLAFSTVGSACRTTYEVQQSATAQGPWTRAGYGSANLTGGAASLSGFSSGSTLWVRLSVHPCGLAGVLTSNLVSVSFLPPLLRPA